MNKYVEIIKNVPLFRGIQPSDLENMLQCLRATSKHFEKGDVILLAGSKVTDVGIVLVGNVQIIKENIMGNQTIIAELEQTDLFAETFACAGIEMSPVSVVAVSPCEILFVSFKHIITTCSSACTFHSKLIENILGLMARKNLMLKDKVELLSQRTLREKLCHYFELSMQKESSASFTIPFNRNELADYLCVDRSALSRELCNMRDEGILEFDKNRFTMILP